MLYVRTNYYCTLIPEVPASPWLVLYYPSRKAYSDRRPSYPTVGVNLLFFSKPPAAALDVLTREKTTLRDLESTGEVVFTWVFDIDRGVEYKVVQQVCRTIRKEGEEVTAVCRTSKGWHLYTSILEEKASRVIRFAYSIARRYRGLVDHHQIHLARWRGRYGLEMGWVWGLIRIGGKYREPDITVIEEDTTAAPEPLRTWLRNVLTLIRRFREVVRS